MESLTSYMSDGESDSSTYNPYNPVSKKSVSCPDEVDANCEPITMDMSEDSRSGHSDENDESFKKVETKRHYSKSLSPSPPTSVSSKDSSPGSKRSSGKIRSSSERSKYDSSKNKRRDDERRSRDDERRNKDSERRSRDDEKRSRNDRSYKVDDDHSRSSRRERSQYRYRDRDSERHDKRYDSRRSNRSRSRSRSPSYSKHRSSKRKHRSRSRSRSHDRHHRKRSPQQDRHQRRSPPRSRRSRSSSKPKEKPKTHEWKPSAKLKVLEKLGIELKVPPTGIDVPQMSNTVPAIESTPQLTPQLLLQKTVEEQVEKVKTATGIQLPSYYNPMAVNPTKYAEQIQKRRLLWGNKGKESQTNSNEVNGGAAPVTEAKSSGTIWKGATFGGDQDGKMTAKFQRLMGMKNPGPDTCSSGPVSAEPKVGGSDLIKKQEEMFHSMESQYEVARLATHSHRGLGLGFGTFQPR